MKASETARTSNCPRRRRMPGLCVGLGLASLLTWTVSQAADTTPPAQGSPGDAVHLQSSDGLRLEKDTRTRKVFIRPGTDFAKYRRVAILDCPVEFEKGWQQSYNNTRTNFTSRVSDADVQRMKTALSDQFKKVFTREMEKDNGYQVVNTAGPDVLVLRPALVNVNVTAPDIVNSNVKATVVRSAGSMTLYLELWDASTNTILARLIDARTDVQGSLQRASSVTNTKAADDILSSWARELRGHLDAIREKGAPA